MLQGVEVEPSPNPPQPIFYLRQGQPLLRSWYPDHIWVLSVLQRGAESAHNIVESPG